VVCLLNGARCHAQGHGDAIEQAHAALVEEARELHAALGPWLAEQDEQSAARGDRDEDMAHEVVTGRGVNSPVVALLALVKESLDDAIAEGTGASRKEALASLRSSLVKLHASQWAAFARAEKGGE
jgi:hypothetical protein